MMRKVVYMLGLIFLFTQCTTEDSIAPTAAGATEFTLSGTLNGSPWEGRIFDAYINETGELIINSQIESDKDGVDVEQITLFLPDFEGVGSYNLKELGAMYREWCCGDLIVFCTRTNTLMGDSVQIQIQSFDLESLEVQGTLSFTASQVGCEEESFLPPAIDGVEVLRFENGYFQAKLVE
ncbi:MAG: hypothetical protein AAF694_03135 [Bacteroidota bacterium]